MNVWIVWFFNPYGFPKVQSREVEANDLLSLASMLPGAGIDMSIVFATHLKGTAPMIPGISQ